MRQCQNASGSQMFWVTPCTSLFFCFFMSQAAPCPQAPVHLVPVEPLPWEALRSKRAHVTKVNTGKMTSEPYWKADPKSNLLRLQRQYFRARLSCHLSSRRAVKQRSLWGAERDREVNYHAHAPPEGGNVIRHVNREYDHGRERFAKA